MHEDLLRERVAYTYNISSLTVDTIFNAFWSHPPNWNLLLTLFFTLTKVVSDIHVLCQSKVSYLNYTILVNPESQIVQFIYNIIGPHVKEHNSIYKHLHTVSCSEISMNKLIPGKIFHTLTDLAADTKTTFSYSSHL